MFNVLSTIVEYKKERVANSSDFHDLELSQRDFKAALNQPQLTFIMECKKASTSRGLIRSDFDLEEIVGVYNRYADAISVLTEDRFFKGSFQNLQKVRELTDKPILCKDFIIDPKQVRQARYYGADAVLLMLSVLDDHGYVQCLEQAKKLNMDVLTEVHDDNELSRAISLGSDIIGINNRNLKDLSTSLSHTYDLVKKIPKDKIIISESGINNHQDILNLAPYCNGVLVGSSLMSHENLEKAASNLVYGDIKICGVTNQADSDLLQELPVGNVGVIFAEKSKRSVSSNITSKNKPLVGVFQNHSLDFVKQKVQQYQLSMVQLHGSETQDYIRELKTAISNGVAISKVIHIDQDTNVSDFVDEIMSFEDVDEILLDSQLQTVEGNQQGGTGKVFDWELLMNPKLESLKTKIRIAGGVNADNIQRLKQLGFVKIDVASGSEQKIGVKSEIKIKAILSNAKVLARSEF